MAHDSSLLCISHVQRGKEEPILRTNSVVLLKHWGSARRGSTHWHARVKLPRPRNLRPSPVYLPSFLAFLITQEDYQSRGTHQYSSMLCMVPVVASPLSLFDSFRCPDSLPFSAYPVYHFRFDIYSGQSHGTMSRPLTPPFKISSQLP